MNRLALLLIVPALALGGCVNRAAQEQGKRTEKLINDPVRVVKTMAVPAADLQETFEVTGQLTTSDDAQVGAKAAGRLVAVYVRDGDAVTAGQLLASVDTAQLSSQVSAALSQVRAAQAQLAQAVANARIAPSRSDATIRTAEAGVAQARAQLQKSLAGARTEERRQAEAALRAAKTALDIAKRNLERTQRLVNEGAIGRASLDAAETQYASALAQYETALEGQNIAQNAVRSEDIETAREAVRQAQAQLESARAAKRLDVTLTDQVEAARAQVAAAQAQARIAQQQLADAQVRAPFSGRVAGRPLQPGTVVAPGTPIVRLVGGDGTYFEADVPETGITRLQIGSAVTVRLTALPNETFPARIAAVSPVGSGAGRLFSVRVQLATVDERIKPGMFATGSIVLRTVRDVPTVPVTALVQRQGKDVVYLVVDGKAVLREVTPGVRQGERVQVQGIRAGDTLIVEGQTQVVDGTEVRVDEAPAERTARTQSGS